MHKPKRNTRDDYLAVVRLRGLAIPPPQAAYHIRAIHLYR